MNHFWSGFEKRAYDYSWEAREAHEDAKERSKMKPVDVGRFALGGGLGAALAGAIVGGIHGAVQAGSGRRMQGAGLGALLGGGLGGVTGGAMGALIAITHNHGIEEAKRIMKMQPKQRDEYLKSMVRNREISQQQYEDFNRELRNERRHREMLDALDRGERLQNEHRESSYQ